ncbi:MAG: carboxymuconolactone decarboxylase family protein, partial [Solirubrobacteraceae bacterium]
MLALEGAVRGSGLEPLLLELVKLRASQINGCAHCLDMHSKDARARGARLVRDADAAAADRGAGRGVRRAQAAVLRRGDRGADLPDR